MAQHGTGFELDKVTVAFHGRLALDSVSVRVEPGEAVAFVGPSGAGKTSLLRLLNGSIRPRSGKVKVGGCALAGLPNAELRSLRSRIGFVHQSLDLVPNLRVVQNVMAGRLGSMGFFASLRAMLFPRRDQLRFVHEILERVGIAEKIFERTDKLSGGQQQRVAIARVLYQEASALLVDEPLSSLDPARSKDTIALLTRISQEEQITLCASLHDLDLAREHFDRLVGLRHGRVVFDCATRDVREVEFESLYQLESREMLENGR